MNDKPDFWQLLRESTLTQAFLAIVCILTASIAVLTNHILPDWYMLMTGTIIGFYFRAKNDVAQLKATRQASEQIVSNVAQAATDSALNEAARAAAVVSTIAAHDATLREGR